ncbi:class I SAM-dependent methyltransferase [Candidatus Pacearchaeota archaeon]|nr:class I SAM-dependent methyltransferase [Candidatus Pacearchaeota archaeon]
MDKLKKFKIREQKRFLEYSKFANFNTTMVENMQTLSSMTNYYNWLSDIIRPHAGQRILDVGVANGNLSNFFLDKDFLMGLDVSQDYLEIVKKRFAGKSNFHTFLSDASDANKMMALKKYKFDTAITMNVLEHIEDDSLAIKNVYNVLEPGAKFLVIVPAMNFLYAILDFEGGHFRRYTKQELGLKLKRAGFKIIKMHYINVAGALGWYLNYVLLKKKLFAKGTFKLYNNLVPLFRVVESIVKFPFGMSVIAIAEKPRNSN